MTKPFHLFFSLIIIIILPTIIHSQSQSAPNDAAVMQALKTNLTPKSLDWSDPNPCNWKQIQCSRDNRVTWIQLRNQNLQGTLPRTLNTLTELQVLELQNNQLTGPLPSLSGLTQLQILLLSYNNFTSIPSGFFTGMSSLKHVYLDYVTFSSWVLPETLKSASSLQVFSATSANITGTIPDFFGGDYFSKLTTLHLGFNSLEGGLPNSFFGSSIQSLRLNGQNSRSKLNGTLDVLESMIQLTEVWLHGNMFTGTLPDFSALNDLQTFSVRDNSLIGPVPESLTELRSLKVVNLTNNMFQGPKPSFGKSVEVDISGRNSFCLPDPGVGCDDRVNKLLAVVESVGYPQVFAENWKGNDPCEPWLGIKCSASGNITVVNLQGMGLTGCISPDFAAIKSLQRLLLADNNLSGMIPDELKDLPILIELDVSYNQLYGRVPEFKQSVKVRTDGNVDIEKDGPSTTPVSPAGGQKGGDRGGGGKTGVVVGLVVGGLVVVAGLLAC
ncbi:putative non-specific serine/threonine protein kinase [Helianthus annuus]|nr:putative non-specific serine/threonine protein kinase [Helianthus annuus]KAJ0495366.1 putative non-specific serine/threonine protein kinase [Helianthus annuus]KAJ0506916.1 putative non-specific serine/threonine protein kinase [Helianthus annuus]KAJ0676552.1 putative non-specific serine/threonine protein kinase [Helianthus annuus]KAJ0868418.1 putative non-specific serine/threonine protein kinase [Helianthus annuus]